MQARPSRSTTYAGSTDVKLVMPTIQQVEGKPQAVFLNNRITNEDNFTWIRPLPSFDEHGQECAFMLDNAQPKEMESYLADAFFSVEMMDFYKPGIRQKVITTIAPQDSRGNDVRFPKNGQTPAMAVVQRFNWMCHASKRYVANGYDPLLPDDFIALYNSDVTGGKQGGHKPTLVWLIQALAFTLDGITKKDAAGNTLPIYGLYPLQTSAFKQLMAMLSCMRNPTLAVSQSNLKPDNDVFSCAGGHSLIVNMKKEPGKDGTKRPTYFLQSSEKMPYEAADLFSLVSPWQQLLPDPTIDESIQTLIEWLGPVVVDYGLKDTAYEDYIPAAARGSSKHVPLQRISKDMLANLMPKAPAITTPGPLPTPPMALPQAPATGLPPPMAPAMGTPPPPAIKPAVQSRPLPTRSFVGDDDDGGLGPVESAPQLPPPPAVINVAQPLPQPSGAPTAVPPQSGAFAKTLGGGAMAQRLQQLANGSK